MIYSTSPSATAIRILAADSVQKANSGHPGAPMGMADIAKVLWQDFMSHNPSDPAWVNRDRFVLSNGHGSMLQYALLHLTGYDVSMEDLKQFRQLHSKTPGHPEYGYTPGVETTTGPLGAGIANAVGMAIAEKTLAAQFNQPNYSIVDHYTYCFLGDGCLMEGISHEVCSLAGTLGLGKLIAFWDDNGISIDGNVEGWFTDDTVKRFESYGWHVLRDIDGHNEKEVSAAISVARSVTQKPTLICCKTTIGFGAPTKAGSHASHGSPLGDAEIEGLKKALGWESDPFTIPENIYAQWDARARGNDAQKQWQALFEDYACAFPELANEFTRRAVNNALPAGFDDVADVYIRSCQAAMENVATRKASQNAITYFAKYLPELIGGSADLAGSNLTLWPSAKGIETHAGGNYIYYGVREFGMSAIMNGIALHGGFKPFGATFLMFMEYARNAVRMAALMKTRSIFVYTHDSIGQGEDGPTHQPVEQLANLRMTPNLVTWRPCDATETAAAWRHALSNKGGPTALVFTRQGTVAMKRSESQLSDIMCGGYILKGCKDQPSLVLIATGSEVNITVEAAKILADEGIAVRVVSMPSTSIFDKQDKDYRDSVLPLGIPKLAVEAAHEDYWRKYVGLEGDVIGMSSFGESAPGNTLFNHFGFTVDNIVQRAKAILR